MLRLFLAELRPGKRQAIASSEGDSSMKNNSARKIQKVWKSTPTIEGAGVHLKRAFGNSQVAQLDPFLLLDDFRSENPDHYLKGFPGIPTGASKRSPMFFPARSNTATVLETKGPFIRVTCSG
jgi:hypothetical protein